MSRDHIALVLLYGVEPPPQLPCSLFYAIITPEYHQQKAKMRNLAAVALVLSTLAAAAPSGTGAAVEPPSRVIAARQGIITPPPCEAMDPPPTEEETEARFDLFVQAFINEADLSEAFKYIANDYIVSLPIHVSQRYNTEKYHQGSSVECLCDCYFS